MDKNVVKLELFLVRHGESMSNSGQEKSLNDDLRFDPPLSEKGLREAELLGEYFSELPFDYILASGLRRASRTAVEVANRQPKDGSHEVEIHSIFTECNTGVKTKGRTIDEIHDEWPAAVLADGEIAENRLVYHEDNPSDEVLLERGKRAINYILGRFHNGERVMVAAHAAFNTFMLYAALGLNYKQDFDPDFYNTGITKIVFYKEGTGSFSDVVLKYHNAVPHLVDEFKEFRY